MAVLKNNYRALKFACYFANISMSIVGNMSPLFFLIFRDQYGLSYSLLGTLVLANFTTQLLVDLFFSFFSHRINMKKALRLMPILTSTGLLIYALSPLLFPQAAFPGILIGTIIFSASGGFNEVLLSPVFAAIPADDPDREMSKLHSSYAWGVVAIIIISTLFLHFVGSQYWYVLTLIFLTIPVLTTLMFLITEIPDLETPEKAEGALKMLKNKSLLFCILAIFLGGASECSMAQWCSGYLEAAVGLPKVWGDILGVAMFSLFLGLGRSLYAKYGKNLELVLVLGTAGATVCYLVSALSPIPFVGLFACAFTGFCASMLWPGTLVHTTGKFPLGGVFIYAIMAAGGDLGASVGPQLVGIVADAVSASGFAETLSVQLGLGVEQIGMKAGMLVGAIFPLAAFFVMSALYRSKKKAKSIIEY